MPNPQRRSFPRPRSVRGWLLTAVAAVVAVGAAGVLFIYFVLFSHSAPAPLALDIPGCNRAIPRAHRLRGPGNVDRRIQIRGRISGSRATRVSLGAE